MMLPPFRIRNLHGRNHAVIQVTAPQYDSTLKSHPNAALTYLDDDDGETITVGSGRELSERLDEPVTVPVASFDFRSVEENNMHSFDINHASDSLAVWTDHEAYTSKSIKSDSSVASTSSRNQASSPKGEWRDPPVLTASDTWSSNASEPLDVGKFLDSIKPGDQHPVLTVQSSKPDTTNESSSASSQAETNISTQQPTETGSSMTEEILRSSPSIVGELDAHINTLADFLQGTSTVLAKAAEKTREADPSAVENVIQGFKGIFGEVLNLAKSALESFDVEPASSNVNIPEATEGADKGKTPVRDSVPVSEPLRELVEPGSKPELGALATQLDEWCATPAVRHGIKTAMNDFMEAHEKKLVEKQNSIESKPFEDTTNTDKKRESKHAYCEDEEDLTRRKRVSFKDPPPPAAAAPAIHYRHGIWLPRETAKGSVGSSSRSILDLDSSDPDFSARYPPLLTLRRSRTTGTLRERSKSPARSTQNHQEALKRYPSVQQLEGRNMEHRIKHEVNDRKGRVWIYGHDADTRSTTPPGEPQVRPAKFDRDTIRWVNAAKESDKSTNPSYIDMPLLPFDFSEEGTDRSRCLHNARTESNKDKASKHDRREASTTRKLPGAWPEPQGETGSSALPTSHESSGAFFERMTRPSTGSQPLMSQLPSKPLFPRLSEERLRAPHSDYYHCPPLPLNRAKSVSALNPAARLNKPFQPFIPELVIPNTQQTTQSSTKSTGFPSADLKTPDTARFVIQVPTPARYRERKHQRTMSPVRGTARAFVPDFIDDGYISSTDLPRRRATERQVHRRRPYGDRFSGSGRMSWEAFEGPKTVRPSKSTPQLEKVDVNAAPEAHVRPFGNHPEETQEQAKRQGDPSTDYYTGSTKKSKVDECVQQLRELGYGRNDPHEAARLKIYASAASSELLDAIDMIEEDRRAVQDFVPKGLGDMGSWRDTRDWL